MYYDNFDSPLGIIHLLADDSGLRSLAISRHHPFENSQEWQHSPKHLSKFKRQILEYLSGKRKRFTLPLAPEGTKFQQDVWAALQRIPFGETRSYLELSRMIGNPKACRAVGMANNVNPLPLIIPCHRVIGSDGTLVGYRYGVDIKKKLLELEKHGERHKDRSEQL